MATSFSLSTLVNTNIPKNFYPDHAYDLHPTLMTFIGKAKTQDGGRSYDPNRIATKDATSTWFAGTTLSAVISSASQTGALLNETYPWTSVITPITLTYEERLKASGDSEEIRIKMQDAKKAQAKLDHMDALGAKLYAGDGTSNTPRGFLYLIQPTGAYGSADPSADADWAGQATTSATVMTGPSTLTDAYIPCMHNNREPDLMPTGATLYAKISNIFGMGIQTQNKDDQKYKFGIKGLEFMNAKIYLDRDISSGDIPFLCSDVIELRKSSKFWMKYKEPVEPTDGTNIHLSQVGYMLSSFILAATERRCHGGYTSLT